MSIESYNQKHGKTFEDLFKSAYPGSSDNKRSNTADFDIEGKFNKEGEYLPISIKTTKSDSISLSDARRFFKCEGPYYMLIGIYEQNGKKKILNKIYEIKLTKDFLKKIKGQLDYDIVKEYHDKICSFKKGYHKEARELAKDHKKKLGKEYSSLIKLNPKIDSKSQRRLQCSVSLNELLKQIDTQNVIIYTEEFKNLGLPLTIISSPRKLKSNEQ